MSGDRDVETERVKEESLRRVGRESARRRIGREGR